MSSSSPYYTGFSPPRTIRQMMTRRNSPSPTRRRSAVPRRTTFKGNTPPSLGGRRRNGRRSKKRSSPRARILRRVYNGMKRHSPSRFKNKYIRNLAELSIVLAPFIAGGLAIALYNRSSPSSDTPPSSEHGSGV